MGQFMETNRLFYQLVSEQMSSYFAEDDLVANAYYLNSLPENPVSCELRVKSDLTMAGLPFFCAAFCHLGAESKLFESLQSYEGQQIKAGSVIASPSFFLPFSIALSGERVALNLLAHACAVATMTTRVVKELEGTGVVLLDTRKTTPGLRELEKYAVRVGGGHNHRFSQTDVWMIKDNHKAFFGGLTQAYEFFKKQGGFYRPIVVEVHSLEELKLAQQLGAKHIMLDNFTPQQVSQAVALKEDGCTFEVSGGVTIESIKSYAISGVDAISMGALTHSAPSVDISFKYQKFS